MLRFPTDATEVAATRLSVSSLPCVFPDQAQWPNGVLALDSSCGMEDTLSRVGEGWREQVARK